MLLHARIQLVVLPCKVTAMWTQADYHKHTVPCMSEQEKVASHVTACVGTLVGQIMALRQPLDFDGYQ